MLSLTCKTAIKAVIYLASVRGSHIRTGIKEIADSINANEHTVGKLLQTLVKQGIVKSIKGPSGGFYVSEAQSRLPLLRIVDAIDGQEIFRGCGLGLSKCSSNHPCPIHNEFKIIRDLIHKLYSEKRIIDLCEPVNTGYTYLAG